MGEWLYYNLSVESFHTKKLCSRLYSIKIEFCLKNKKSLFEPPFERLRDNVSLYVLCRFDNILSFCRATQLC